MRRGPVTPRSGPAWSGARFPQKARNGGLRRAATVGAARVVRVPVPVAVGELKFHDVDLDDAVVATGGTVTPTIAIIPQGVTEIQRVGRKCTINAIGWRFSVSLPEVDGVATPPNPDTVRVLLFQDKQANKATAAVTDILESADYQSFNNLANKGRFRTLMDRTYAINYTTGLGIGADGDYTSVRVEDSFFGKCNIDIEYTAATGDIDEITSNNIGVLLISQAGVAKFDSKFRLRFTDV